MNLIAAAARIALALLFGIAGVGKLLAGFSVSRKTLADFGLPRWLVGPVSVSLPLAELVIAILLLAPPFGREASVAALALLLIFNAISCFLRKSIKDQNAPKQAESLEHQICYEGEILLLKL